MAYKRTGRPHGRPFTYTQEVGDEICRRMQGGEAVSSISRDEHMPPEGTIYGWFVQGVEGFAEPFARARDARAVLHADQIMDLANNVASAIENMDRDKARSFTEAARLQLDAMKWWAARVAPRRFGDRSVGVTATTEGGQRIIVEVQQVDRDE